MFTELIRPLFIAAWLLINKESEGQLCDEKQSSHAGFDFQKRQKNALFVLFMQLV